MSKKRKIKVTAKQKSARSKNMAIARKSRWRGKDGTEPGGKRKKVKGGGWTNSKTGSRIYGR